MVELIWDNKKEILEEVNSKDFLKTDKCFEYNKEESKNFDTTENLYIEGDNLEALKLLQKDYNNKIKMIYIDPPYNTEKKFIYNDTFRNKRKKECRHSGWLNMMYPRLKLARDLLSEEGVVFISIDDNEVNNLKKICDEIFGGNNFIAELPTIMNLNGNNDAFGFVDTHEYTLCYVKDKSKVVFGNLPMNKDELDKWNIDEHGYWKKADTLRRTGQDASRERRPKGWFPVFITENNKIYVTDDDKPTNDNDLIMYPINENGEELSWTWSKKKIIEDNYNLIVTEGKNGKNIYKKQRPSEGNMPTKKPKSQVQLQLNLKNYLIKKYSTLQNQFR